MQLPETPLILVLLVATDGARWLPETLRALRAQQHRPIDILAVDNASTDGSGALLTKSLGARRVVTLERRVGYGRALAAALRIAADRGQAPDAFLLVHDDAALAPGCIEALVAALRIDQVGIAGAKLVEWDDPARLQEVGQSTDRYGRLVPRVDRGELDQGQHDGVHDVLFSSSAVLLVARAVVEEVGLFDGRYVAMRDDLDLCWRARLAGHRTVVTTDASARHAQAIARDLRASAARRRTRYFADRNTFATLIKNYSAGRLLLVLPLAIVGALLSAVLYVVTGKRRAAVQVLEAMQWNIVHLPSTLRARVRTQRTRKAPDTVIAPLMHHGANRFRGQFERLVEIIIGDVDEGTEFDLDRPPPRIRDRLRAHPAAMASLGVIVLMLVGLRGIFFGGPLAGLDLAPFPDSARAFLTEFTSGWRGAAHGGAAPATPGLVLLGMFTWICFGSAWLAQRLALIGLPIMGAIGCYRLARALGAGLGARTVAALVYGFSPVMLGTFGAGMFGDLVLLAAAPFIVLRLLRAADVLPWGWRDVFVGSALIAVAASLAPWTLVFAAGATLVLAFIGSAGPRVVLARGAMMLALPLAILFPWSIELFKDGSAIGAGGGGGFDATIMRDLVGLSGASVRPVARALLYGIPVAAVAGALLSARTRAVASLCALGVAGLGTAWAVSRGIGWIAPRPALPLVASALTAAVLVAFAFEAVGPRLSARAFGLGHVVTALVGAGLVAQLGAGALWFARAEFPGVRPSGELAPSFLPAEALSEGAFRVAWISGSAREPQVDLTGPEGRTMTQYLTRAAGEGDAALRRIVASIAGGSTESGGRLLATFGVRYAIVRPEARDDLKDAVARQVDLAFAQTFRGAAVYRNEIELPSAAAVRSSSWVSASNRSVDALAGADASPRAGKGLVRERRGVAYAGSTVEDGKAILLAEDYSAGWRARIGSKDLLPVRSFGWATKFALEDGSPARVRIVWSGQRWHRLALLFQLAIALAFVASWSQRAARERGER